MFIRSNISMSTFSKICFPLMSIPFLMLLFVFLCDATAFLRSLTNYLLLIVDTCWMIYLQRLRSYLSDRYFLCLLSVDFVADFLLFGILCSSPIHSIRIQERQVLLL